MLRIIVNTLSILFFLKIIGELKSDQNFLSNVYSKTFVNTSLDIDNEVNIVGGFKARTGQFPYMVAIGHTLLLKNRLHSVCGGSIIGEKDVLTAAHCFYSTINPKSFVILAGTVTLNLKAVHQLLDVEGIVKHPKYKGNYSGFDIAIVKTFDKFRFNEFVKIIQLGSITVNENEVCFVSGWGAISKDGRVFRNRLNGLIMHTRNYSYCSQYHKLNMHCLNIICAGGIENEDSCYGDSGGPLVCNEKQYGVVSFGAKKCAVGVPTYYCDVTVYTQWVSEVLQTKSETPIRYTNMVLQLVTTLFALLLNK